MFENLASNTMLWENTTPTWTDLPDSDVPAVLIDGLERLTQGASLVKLRLRWRPHNTAATSFLTKDRLLELQGESVITIARAVASHATFLHERGDCENKFEAQIQREFTDPPEDGPTREWRSVTFYVCTEDELDRELRGDLDERDEDLDDEPTWSSGAARPRPRSAPMIPPRSAAPRLELPGYIAQYSGLVELSRTDPTAFVMLMQQRSHDRTVEVFERLLGSSVDRLDTMLSKQVSQTRHLNQGLQTLTQGAGQIAGLGVNLFQQGLEGQARVARMEHESELGKERTELMRDAVKQGSLLIQAVLMANTAKHRQAQSSTPSPSPAPDPAPSSSPPSTTSPPARHKSDADRDLEARARRVLELATPEVRAQIRDVAPSLAAVFDELGEGDLDANAVRSIIRDAQTSVDREELAKANDLLDAELSGAFASLLMRVLSEDM